MGVKVEVHGRHSANSYPLIMHDPDTQLIVFLESAGCGTVLRAGNTRYHPGYYGTNWTMNRLIRFDGRVTLENN